MQVIIGEIVPRVTNIKFLPTKSIHNQEKSLRELIKIIGIAKGKKLSIDLFQTLFVNSQKKCMEISLYYYQPACLTKVHRV